MASTINDVFVVNAGGGWSYLARIKDHDGTDILQADLTSISRVIQELDKDGAVTSTATDAITIATVIKDTLQTDTNLWALSYNIKDDVEASKIANRALYTVQYTFTPVSGEVFKSKEIHVRGD
jgi:hypothetical protein